MPGPALIRVRELQRVFGTLAESNFEAMIARLSVLYEDLRIELFGIAEDSLGQLDQLGEKYRRVYFLRKSIGSLSEFADAVHQLENCPEFRLVSSHFTEEVARYWIRASTFFRRNGAYLTSVRNDTGGHFGLRAARYAVSNVRADAVNGIEMSEPFTERSRVLLYFAGELVSTAMLRQAVGVDTEHRIRRLIRIARVGYRHAARCVHCVVFSYLWERFA